MPDIFMPFWFEPVDVVFYATRYAYLSTLDDWRCAAALEFTSQIKRLTSASGTQQEAFLDLHQYSDFLESLVESAARNMIVDGVDRIAGGWQRVPQLFDEALIRHPIFRDVVLQVHHLNAIIEPLDRRVGGLRGDRVLLAKDRRLAVDQERSAVAGLDDAGFADASPPKPPPLPPPPPPP